MTVTVGVVGDFDPASRHHRATNDALAHTADALSADLQVRWLPTESLREPGAREALTRCDGLWISPGSPYRSLDGALSAIRFARENNWPLVGT
jgi:CTP synthase (UTP-ammonia lyase)